MLASGAGLRGAAIGHDLFHMVFCVCLFSVAVQGSLLPWVAERLDMTDSEESLRRTFNDYQGEQLLHLTQLTLGPGHPWLGRRLADCHMAADTLVVMIRRGGEALAPGGETVLVEGDLLVISTPVYEDLGAGMPLRELPVGRNSPWAGRRVQELELPPETLIVLVRRIDGSAVVPKGGTLIQPGDTLVVTDRK